ncbi:MAG: D-2-hydroxyacid dehydrogenase [Ruminococcaceae bacterium]|nr:D-2-hydroxyacid dehydrogenase [Oscillospiraceae bacterium]
MKIVILDRCTVTAGDIDFSPLDCLGNVEYYDIVSSEQIVSVANDAEVLVCNKAKISGEIMRACPSLKLICLFATGYDNIDILTARELGIKVCNAPDYSSYSVAQEAIAFILHFSNQIAKYNDLVQDGYWTKYKTFTGFYQPICELYGKTLGIIGCGNIGQKTAKMAEAMGMNVCIYSRTKKDLPYEFVSFEELMKRSDFISVHCPLTDETREIINKDSIALMKPTAYIINTSRGGTICEKDLAEALKERRIAGAGIDVLTQEPMKEDCLYKGIENCIIAPHVGWASLEARKRLIGIVEQNIKDFIDGNSLKNNVIAH